MPTITSNFLRLSFKNKVSAGKGPEILYLFFNNLIVGLIIFSSSLKILILSQCGLSPVTAILGFLLKYSLQKELII